MLSGLICAIGWQIMGLMELAGCRSVLVGGGGSGQLLAATRKKVAIAAELVANPSILFLDVSWRDS